MLLPNAIVVQVLPCAKLEQRLLRLFRMVLALLRTSGGSSGFFRRLLSGTQWAMERENRRICQLRWDYGWSYVCSRRCGNRRGEGKGRGKGNGWRSIEMAITSQILEITCKNATVIQKGENWDPNSFLFFFFLTRRITYKSTYYFKARNEMPIVVIYRIDDKWVFRAKRYGEFKMGAKYLERKRSEKYTDALTWQKHN